MKTFQEQLLEGLIEVKKSYQRYTKFWQDYGETLKQFCKEMCEHPEWVKSLFDEKKKSEKKSSNASNSQKQENEKSLKADHLNRDSALVDKDNVTKFQKDCLDRHAIIVDEFVHEGKDKIAAVELSSDFSSDDGSNKYRWDDHTQPLERSVYEDINTSESGRDSLTEETTHEEDNKHLFAEQSNQPFDTWDPGVLAPQYDEYPTKYEFHFD